MTIQLSQPDFRKLCGIVQNLSNFANVRDRRRLLARALEGVPKADVVLSQLDLDGAPIDVASEVIIFLADFGQVAYGKEALGVFLNYIQSFMGDDKDAEFITSLFAKYPLNEPIASERLIDHWHGTDSIVDIQEKIIGENTLRHIYLLNLASESAKTIVHLQSPQGLGTGFMIASNLLMTNNHVIASAVNAQKTEYTFNYQLGLDGLLCTPVLAQSLPDGLFYTNAGLDYTVVQLKDVPDFGKPLVLKRIQVNRDDRVTIIQHPGGHLKKISMQNNFVAYADTRIVQYTTSTMRGSSGSPVFNDDFEVIAIHHSGGLLIEPNTGRRYLRNAGTSMVAVLDDLKAHAVEVNARLKD